MEVKRVVVGELEENCYILENNGKTLIIDPGDEADKIIDTFIKPIAKTGAKVATSDSKLKTIQDAWHNLVNFFSPNSNAKKGEKFTKATVANLLVGPIGYSFLTNDYKTIIKEKQEKVKKETDSIN